MHRSQISRETWDYVWIRDGGICIYCKDAVGEHVDHVFPVAKGGKNIRGNLVLACLACNVKKRHHMIESQIAHAFRHLLSVGESLDWVDKITGEE